MGHIHLGRLLETKPWKAVVAALDGAEADGTVIALSTRASERDLARAADDPVYVETVRLLAMIPQAARRRDFGRGLRDLGVPAADEPDLPTLLAAVGDRLDRHARAKGRTDFGELSQRALMGVITTGVGDALPSLFGADAEDVRRATAAFASPGAFSGLARGFYARLMSDSLAYWLDRTLAAHVGPGLRFADAAGRASFDRTVHEHCFETTRMIREFSAGWLAKTMAREGDVDTARATVFGAVAFRKILAELSLRRGADA